ncbi:MAG TPA: L,D-transpeptidase [Rhizomicrobium sp.]|nr:L,D-transpeptidase [Rhizomicrobium sp.]
MRKHLIPACALVLLLAASPALAASSGASKSSMAETDVAALKPGEFIWHPQVSPRGPMTIIVNLRAQRAYVYRNGVRIGASTVSTGKPGKETPTGVFTILQKKKDHRSSLYNNAPMPFMQRLTWDGIALHAGHLPGHPASHGCVRLPLAFSEALFAATTTGMTVVITDEKPATQNFLAPKSMIPDVTAPGSSPAGRLAAGEPFRWQPQLSPTGPITILVSAADRRMLVLRNGIVIGHARVEIPAGRIIGTHAAAFTGFDPAGREKWFAIGLPGREGEEGQALDIAAQRDILIPPDFYKNLLAALAPGATLVLTDGSILGGGEGTKIEVLESM